MRTSFAPSPIALALAAWTGAFVVGPAQGAGFLLNESSASGLGSAFAGGAAAATDASTLWSNPAGLARLKGSQVVGVVHVITPSMKLSNDGTTAAVRQPSPSGEGGDAGGVNFVPNLYVSTPINAQWSAGIGLNAPWGLVTEYESDWMGRFQAIKSSIKTYNLNPAVSWKPAGGVALGFGLNLQRLEGEFTNRANYAGLMYGSADALLKGGKIDAATFGEIAASTFGLESAASIKGSDNAAGWNLGLLWDLDANQRLGFHYRSAIDYHLGGNARFAHPALPVMSATASAWAAQIDAGIKIALPDSGIASDVRIPAIVNLSYFGAVGGAWDLMVDAQWTGWSSIQSLAFVRTDGNGMPLPATPLNFKDTWKFALGFNYRPGSDWTWRGGLAFDQTPVKEEFRTARLPDADRTWLTGGAQVRMNNGFKLDFGAAYIWVKNARIANNGGDTTGASYGVLNGNYNSSTWILSMQGTWAF